jgi:signal peptidase I
MRAGCPRLLDVLVLLVCGGVLLHAFGLEPFRVPTGSMAPTVLGNHRVCDCPNCGMVVRIGKCAGDRYERAVCPNCGAAPLPTADVPETAGDHILVNKATFVLRRPRRWEVIVFRLFGIVLVKRVIGLPGEVVLVKNGDVYIDGRLARKPFDQAWAMRIPVFAQRCRPPSGWAERWQEQDDGPDLVLDGRSARQTRTFCTGPPIAGKYRPLRDEYAYDAGRAGGDEPVHDFLIEGDVEVQAGTGSLALRLCDGQDWVEVALPAGRAGAVVTRFWPVRGSAPATAWTQGAAQTVLEPQRSHHVVMAFVDRRVNVRVDGRPIVADVDLPAPSARDGVGQPVQLEAAGAAVVVRDFRLYRDVHYGDRGRTAVRGEPVRLGVEQYFVLGDNSAISDDSRFWPPDAVSGAQLVGSAFLVHLPSRSCGRWQMPDVTRIRWIR